MTVQKWLAYELEFVSTKKYNNPFEDVDLDVVFTNGVKEMRYPAFWDGGDIWRVRFSLPQTGEWKYVAICTDSENTGLSGEGAVECVPYEGDLEIYKRGFIKTIPNVRYFMYDDGTPFFYLGDTHWSMPKEEFDEPGERAGDIECESHFKYIVDKRVEQGFTVYQSEPNGVKYKLTETLTEEDVEGFKELDRYFKYIADKGLVHSNAQILFPWDFMYMKRWREEAYVVRLARYWAARYSAYPCLWTLEQEVDNDFYGFRGDHKRFTLEDNPFKYVAKGLHMYDPHQHPMTAHMESYAVSPELCGDGDATGPSTSAFRETEGHTWWGVQWNRCLNSPVKYTFGQDLWLNGQGKVAILYESRYEYLYTKDFGARSQGWLAFLNGLYGYGYGAQDIWLYRCNFAMKNDTPDGIDTVTVEDKKIHWSESIKFKTPEQLKYMRDFFESLEWWKLIPRFDSPAYFVPDGENYYSIATDERNTIVIYFCNYGMENGYSTGRLTNLDFCEYSYQWFNPRTNEYSEIKKFYPDAHRTYHIEHKPENLDMVLLVKKVKNTMSGKLKACPVLYSPQNEKYAEEIRIFQGCPTIAITKKGRIFVGWYAGGLREPSLDNYNTLCFSDDGGRTFKKNYVVIPSEKDRLVQALDIQLFVSPENKLYVFWVQNDVKHYLQVEGATEGMFGEDYIFNEATHAQFYMVCDDPDAEEPRFSQPIYYDKGFLRCKPTLLKSGRWLLFNYDQTNDRYGYSITDDNLKTHRQLYGGKKVQTPFDEAMAYQRDDGSIRMLARTSTGKTAESISFDDGENWTDGAETEIFNSNTRLYVVKTKSGNVLLVNNERIGRGDMTVLLSKDDGKTFSYNKLIDGRGGLSYPDAEEFNGRHYLVYDRERTGASEIILCSFTENDIIKGNEIQLSVISKPKKELQK